MKTTVTYDFRCAACANRAEQTFTLGFGEKTPPPSLPPGWRKVTDGADCDGATWGSLVCPNHTIIAELRLCDPRTYASGDRMPIRVEL